MGLVFFSPTHWELAADAVRLATRPEATLFALLALSGAALEPGMYPAEKSMPAQPLIPPNLPATRRQ